MSKEDIRIEFPSRGATYNRDQYGVYRYSVYPRSSVLSGQTCRTFLNSFDSIEEARDAYPDATEAGCGYAPPYLGHLSDDDGEAELAYQDGLRDVGMAL